MPSLQESVPGQLTTSVTVSRAGFAESELAEPRVHVVEGFAGDPTEDEVLVDRGPRVAAREVAHHLPEATELLGREIAAGHLYLDR